jgi:hypothetical protein
MCVHSQLATEVKTNKILPKKHKILTLTSQCDATVTKVGICLDGLLHNLEYTVLKFKILCV